MTEPHVPSTAEPLPRALLVALMAEAARAVATVNGAFAVQLTQPAQAPAEAAASQTNLVRGAAGPLLNIWNALEPAQLPSAGAHVILAVIREMAEQGAAGLAMLRQFQTPPAAAEPPSSVPGSPA